MVHPPSRCMRAAQALRWYHNVPVVELAGAARTLRVLPARRCRRAIRRSKLLTGVVFALHAFVFEPGPLLLVRLVFAAVLIVLAFIDIDHRILPNSMTLTGIAARRAGQRVAAARLARLADRRRPRRRHACG